MTENTSQPNIATIRQLLLAAFTPEELRRFCYDRPSFRPIVDRFGPGHGLDDMVDEAITYCDHYYLFPELLAELKEANPRQYASFFQPEPPAVEAEKPQEDQPAPPTPEIPTITSPPMAWPMRSPEEKPAKFAFEYLPTMTECDRAIALNPEDPNAYTTRGLARFGQGDLAGAVADYDRAIELNAGHAFAYWGRGRAREARGDLEEAWADLKRALFIFEVNLAPPSWFRQGQVDWRRGRAWAIDQLHAELGE